MNAYISPLVLFDEAGRRKYLNSDERATFYNQAKRADEALSLFLLMLYWSGARISEVINLTVEQIDLSENIAIIESLKKRKKGVFRQVPLPPDYVQDLKHFLKGNKKDKPIWSRSRRTYSRHIERIMVKAEIIGPQASAKGLRHGFAVHCVLNNVPLTLIQKWMGHASINTTAIYLNIVGVEEKKFAERLWKT